MPRPLDTDRLLRGSVTADGEQRTLTLDPAFQGLPDMAHGGTLLALFDAQAALDGIREVRGHYIRRVPVATPLRLTVAADGAALACRVLDAAGTLLADGRVAAGGADGTGLAAPGPNAVPVPISRTCFACGTDNPLGLAAQLTFDERTVGGRWSAPAHLAAGGRLAPVALTTLLDEAAFWLGALATGESGMTTELRVTLHGLPPPAVAVIIGGERAAVQPRPDDRRYWQTHVSATDEAGRLLATAAITFVAVRGAARRLVTGLLGNNPPDVVRRIFPAYVT